MCKGVTDYLQAAISFPLYWLNFLVIITKKAFFPEQLPLFPSSFFPHFANDSQIHHGDFGAAGNLPLSTERFLQKPL